jgi:hypothetical protein
MGGFMVPGSVPLAASQAFLAPERKAEQSRLPAGDPGLYVWF